MSLIKMLWGYLPESVKQIIRSVGIVDIVRKNKTDAYIKALICDYEKSNDRELKKIVNWVKENGICVYPYDYQNEYKKMDIEVFRDDDDYPYIYVNGKRLYGRKSYTNEQFLKECRGRLAEQDTRSPHCYVSEDWKKPRNNCIIAELGAAEGAFSLEWIEQAEKVYLFECLDEWMVPLKKTFEPWKEKVEIIPKYVGDVTSENSISLDEFFKNRDVNVIKADIEGAELAMLYGGEETFRNKIHQAYLCVYHVWNHEEEMKKILSANGFTTIVNEHYMIITANEKDFYKKKLRHGVVYGEKSIEQG